MDDARRPQPPPQQDRAEELLEEELLVCDLTERLLTGNETSKHENDDETQKVIRRALEEAVEAIMGEDLTRQAAVHVMSETDDDAKQQQEQQLLTNVELITNAVKKAAVRCKQETSSSDVPRQDRESAAAASAQQSPQPTSFSLLNQFHAMSEKRVTVEQLQDASNDNNPSDDALLELLQRVDHVDDVVYGWENVVRPMLYNGLLLIQSGDELTRTYLQIHTTWFGQCTHSMEHLSIRYDLCHNVARAIQQRIIVDNNNEGGAHHHQQQQLERMCPMVQVWHDMWVDLLFYMHLLMDDDVDNMARIMWKLLSSNHTNHSATSNSTKSTKTTNASPVACLLALIDPYAHWFACWMQQLTPARAIPLLRDTGLVQDLIGTCQSYCYHEASAEKHGEECSLVFLQQLSEQDKHALQQACLIQSLSMLRSVLVSTRVALFPWDIVSVSPEVACPTATRSTTATTTAGQQPSLHQLQMILEPFVAILDVGISQPALVDERLAGICREAVETILWGCCQHDFHVLCARVLQRVIVKSDSSASIQPCRRQIIIAFFFQMCVNLLRGREYWTARQEQVDDDSSWTLRRHAAVQSVLTCLEKCSVSRANGDSRDDSMNALKQAVHDYGALISSHPTG